MSFFDPITALGDGDLIRQVESVTDEDVQRVLGSRTISPEAFLCLLSPAAEPHLEQMARQAHDLTVAQFGRTMVLYTPLYLSNFCTNSCVYCGFNRDNRIVRRQLTLAELDVEACAVADTGLKHILILTGDAPAKASVDYIAACCGVLRRYFPAIGIEIYALSQSDYRRLIDARVDSLTIYQETYNETLYGRLHPKGPKRDYRFRLDAPDRACLAGMRAVNVGALLGLDDWRRDIFFTAMHARYLQDRYPETEISVSLPRMRPHVGGFQPGCIVEDRHIVQTMTALRLFLPRVGITISTRENARFRDRLLPLGVTRMSAGSCTAVGGRTEENASVGQFDISDERSVPEMVAMLRRAGWQPVFKDWQCLG
ncbi:thiamine biosynthesis protein ThiH [Desulfosarcina alkanivorans]|uniref:Thiamine biosynthesis protein ThiH n=1 Tax=Desulfosarcina alkanivorans TaxID=571177 RepID=A0A5K7YXY9_9BACT|nr:2-iminoacetate synthase ThiH [Desulfosarcina alkanivorans]BBO71971.1 thiamine biosynthesis protein ThiH [Desulfosarcina alkanivorans]